MGGNERDNGKDEPKYAYWQTPSGGERRKPGGPDAVVGILALGISALLAAGGGSRAEASTSRPELKPQNPGVELTTSVPKSPNLLFTAVRRSR